MLDFSTRASSRDFGSPHEVIRSNLTEDEKRGILADWASDIRAVESEPRLRRLDNGGTISIDAVLAALHRLDKRRLPRRRSDPVKRLSSDWWRPRDHDDDDPPFAPAGAMRPGPRNLPDAGAAVAVPA
jgi:hypothetical protein